METVYIEKKRLKELELIELLYKNKQDLLNSNIKKMKLLQEQNERLKNWNRYLMEELEEKLLWDN